jgi:16S rRNA (guanine966-N2)-methyltransferase
MLDRVREALFSTLQPWTADAVVLDLFAGSGSLGLEALSRGARRVRFVEQAAPALTQLRKNVDTLAVRDRVEVIEGDALRAATWTVADVVFLDPPYALLEKGRARLLATLARLVTGTVSPGGILVLHAPHGALAPPDIRAGTARVRRYGTNDLWYVEPQQGPEGVG